MLKNEYTIPGNCPAKEVKKTLAQLGNIDKKVVVDRITNHPVITKPFEEVRVGSHRQQFGHRGGRRYYQSTDDYKIQFNDCLPGKAWVKAHYQDVIPEPTIEVIVNGKSTKLNGSFKKGMIKQLIKS